MGDQGIGSEPACSSQFDLHWASPHLSWRTFCFLEFIIPFETILSSSMFFCSSIYIETALNFREECNEFAGLLFWRLSLCLSIDSLSCDTRALYLCILLKSILLLIPLIHSAPFLRFSHLLLYTNFFHMYIITQNIFLILDDAVDRRNLGI